MRCSELGSLRGARPPGETGEERREHLWSSAAAMKRSVKSSAGSPEHLPHSGPSSGVVGGLVSQNPPESCGGAERSRCELGACLRGCRGRGGCCVQRVLLNPGETPAWGHWGDSDRDGRG